VRRVQVMAELKEEQLGARRASQVEFGPVRGRPRLGLARLARLEWRVTGLERGRVVVLRELIESVLKCLVVEDERKGDGVELVELPGPPGAELGPRRFVGRSL